MIFEELPFLEQQKNRREHSVDWMAMIDSEVHFE